MQYIRVHFGKDHSIAIKDTSIKELTSKITEERIIQVHDLKTNYDIFVNINQIQYITYEEVED